MIKKLIVLIDQFECECVTVRFSSGSYVTIAVDQNIDTPKFETNFDDTEIILCAEHMSLRIAEHDIEKIEVTPVNLEIFIRG